MSCGCGGKDSTAAGGGAAPGPLLSGTLDDRFASAGLAPIVPVTESVADGGAFNLASLAAFPGGIWAALVFVAAVGYVFYKSAEKGE